MKKDFLKILKEENELKQFNKLENNIFEQAIDFEGFDSIGEPEEISEDMIRFCNQCFENKSNEISIEELKDFIEYIDKEYNEKTICLLQEKYNEQTN